MDDGPPLASNTRPWSRTRVGLSLAVILAAAAALRIWGMWFGLPFGYARPDETYIMDVVIPVLGGQRPAPHYEYPWLYMGLSAVAYVGYFVVGMVTGAFQEFSQLAASWKAQPAPFFLISRGISVVLGTLTVYLVFRLARHLWDERTGLVAAAGLALAYLHVRDSHYGTTDTTMTFFVVWSVLLLLDAHRRGGWHRFALAGLTGGLAVATKYNAAVVVVPGLASIAIYLADTGLRAWREAGRRVVAYGVLFALGAAVGVPFVVMDPAGFLRGIQALVTSTAAGQAHLVPEPGWLTHMQYSLRYGLGIVMLAAGLIGAVLLAARNHRQALLVLAFPLTYFVVMGAAANQYYRYMVPVVPFLCLTAAGVVHAAATLLAARVPPAGRARRSAAVMAGLTVALVAEPGLRAVSFDRAIAVTDNRVVVAEWMKAHVPARSSLLVTGSHYGHPWLAAELDLRTWSWDAGEERYRTRDDEAARPEWILRQEHALSRDRPVVEEWLREGYAVAWRFPASDSDRHPPIFDRMDAFYLPYSGFQDVVRPGPSFTLFRRADLSTSPTGRDAR